jgi:hypothetical protein
MDQTIPLSQKLYLLGIHPEKGGLISSTYHVIRFVLAGALFLELAQQKNIKFEDKKVVFLNDKTSDPIHRYLLEKIKQKSRPVKLTTWINKLWFSQKYIRKGVQQNLVNRRLIRMEPRQFLFFRWEKSHLLDRQIVFRLVFEIEGQIFKGTENKEEIMLLSILKPAGLLKRIFPEREKRKMATKRLGEMMIDNQVSIAVTKAITAAREVTT